MTTKAQCEHRFDKVHELSALHVYVSDLGQLISMVLCEYLYHISIVPSSWEGIFTHVNLNWNGPFCRKQSSQGTLKF